MKINPNFKKTKRKSKLKQKAKLDLAGRTSSITSPDSRRKARACDGEDPASGYGPGTRSRESGRHHTPTQRSTSKNSSKSRNVKKKKKQNKKRLGQCHRTPPALEGLPRANAKWGLTERATEIFHSLRAKTSAGHSEASSKKFQGTPGGKNQFSVGPR